MGTLCMAKKRKRKRRDEHPRAWRTTLWAAHDTTSVPIEGRGDMVSKSAYPRSATRCLHAVASLGATKSPWPTNTRAMTSTGLLAVAMELRRAKICTRLRKQLAKACLEHGVTTVPLLAFERWRFSCKWREDMAQSNDVTEPSKKKRKKQEYDPLIPSAAPIHEDDTQLCHDLERAGMARDHAKMTATALAATSAEAVKQM